jgi:putative membrane protein
MMYYGHGMGVGWSLIVFAVVLPILILAAVVIVSQLRRTPAASVSPDPVPGAERVLADRFARGEMDAEEYEQRLRTLRAARR